MSYEASSTSRPPSEPRQSSAAALSGGRVTVLTGKGDGSFSTAGSFDSGASTVEGALCRKRP